MHFFFEIITYCAMFTPIPCTLASKMGAGDTALAMVVGFKLSLRVCSLMLFTMKSGNSTLWLLDLGVESNFSGGIKNFGESGMIVVVFSSFKLKLSSKMFSNCFFKYLRSSLVSSFCLVNFPTTVLFVDDIDVLVRAAAAGGM